MLGEVCSTSPQHQGIMLKHPEDVEVTPEEVRVPFGKHRGTMLKDLPKEYLGWLTMWECAYYCPCEEDCGGECGNEVLECVSLNNCGRVSKDPTPCDCVTCKSRNYVWKEHSPIVQAARNLAIKTKLCRHCWSRMPPIGAQRSNGKNHDDWDARFLRKKCWREIKLGL